MIENEHQYHVTKAQADKVRQALEHPDAQGDVHPRLLQAQREAAQSMLGDLERELRDYERR